MCRIEMNIFKAFASPIDATTVVYNSFMSPHLTNKDRDFPRGDFTFLIDCHSHFIYFKSAYS